jgi:hypothetical protein
MDAIQFLKQEHQKAKAAFEKVLQATPETRGQLLPASRESGSYRDASKAGGVAEDTSERGRHR